MSSPTKFSLGKTPRTRTGLVPASYTQAANRLSTPSQFSILPTKPKPEKYKYRGDYINERNKNLLHERRRTEKQRRKQFSLDSSNETDSLLVSPRSRSLNTSTDSSNNSSNELLSSDQEKEMKWDSYCQHISCHKLSNDEALTKSENKKHFVSFLRSEAKKRREKSPKKNKEPEPAVVQKKKKPPVPRFSKLARSGGKKDKENIKNQTTPSRPASKGSLQESDNKKITSTTTTKLRYLDFISEKQTGEESPSSPTVKDGITLALEAVNSEKGNIDNDDDSKLFRTQIERIVERAAQMVLKDNTSSTSLDESTADDTNDTNASTSIDKNEKQPNETITDTDDQLQSQKQRLELLEEQVRSMSSSTTDSLVFSSSTIDQDMTERYSSRRRDESISCTSSVTEVLPRSYVQPMSASLVWQQCFGSSSSSYTESSYLTEIDSSSNFLDSRVSESKQYSQTSESQEGTDDHSSCVRSTNESVTEVEPRLLSVQPSIPLERRIQPSLGTCPEQTTALPHINPSTEPTREWEEPEPLPRGQEEEERRDDYQDTFDIDIDDIMPRLAVNKGRSETLVDDLFSLL